MKLFIGQKLIWWRTRSGAYRPLPVRVFLMGSTAKRARVFLERLGQDRYFTHYVRWENLKPCTPENIQAEQQALYAEANRQRLVMQGQGRGAKKRKLLEWARRNQRQAS